MNSASSLVPSFWKDVMDQVMGDFDSIIDFLATALTEEGNVIGDHEIKDDGEFVHYYVDLQNRGILDHLPVVDPALAKRLQDRFARIMGSHILAAE